MNVKINSQSPQRSLQAQNTKFNELTNAPSIQKPKQPDLPMVYSLLIKGHLRAKTNSAK